jgi:hypothetical protein
MVDGCGMVAADYNCDTDMIFTAIFDAVAVHFKRRHQSH